MNGRMPIRDFRVIRRAAWCGVTGLLLSMAVAGLCAFFETDAGVGGWTAGRGGQRLTDRNAREVIPERYGQSPPGTLVLRFRAADRRGVSIAIADVWTYQSFTPTSDAPPRPPTPEESTSLLERRLVLPWLYGDRPWPGENGSDSIWLKLSGWPMRAFWCELRAANSNTANSHTWDAIGGFVIGNATYPGWADWPPRLPRMVPYRPIWVGAIANTVFWAVVVALIRHVPGWLRARIRRRSGLCPACAYDLRGSPANGNCPECGIPRPGAAFPRTSDD